MSEDRAVRPISPKQLDYLPLLRKRLLKVFGSQTPPEFLNASADRSLSIVTASVLISSMKKMLAEGTPPVRGESTTVAPKSEGSGYEEGPSAPAAESYISISQEPLPDPGPMEYWGWTWTCSHSMHLTPMKGEVAPRSAAFLSALAHWGKYHLRKD